MNVQMGILSDGLGKLMAEKTQQIKLKQENENKEKQAKIEKLSNFLHSISSDKILENYLRTTKSYVVLWKEKPQDDTSDMVCYDKIGNEDCLSKSDPKDFGFFIRKYNPPNTLGYPDHKYDSSYIIIEEISKLYWEKISVNEIKNNLQSDVEEKLRKK